MSFVSLCDVDPAYDLVALIEKISATDEKKEEFKNSPLVTLVVEQNYTKLLEDGFFKRIDKILAAPENELDASFSLCFSLLHAVDSSVVSDMILRLATALSKDSTHVTLKLKLLVQLFNLLDTASPLRSTVFLKMLRLALTSKQTDLVLGQFRKIDGWLADWKLSDDKRGEVYLLMSQSYAEAKSAQSKAMSKFYLIKYLKTFNPADRQQRLDTAVEHAATVARAAIADPTTLQCDGLLDLAAIGHLAKSTPAHRNLHSLLKIFALQGITEFNAFVAEHKDAFAALDLNEENARAKMLRLSLISLAQARTELTYAEIKEALVLSDLDAVEDVVIDTCSVGSLDAKLDQANELVQIRRVDQRSFTGSTEAWGKLNTALSLWSENIHSVLNHMAQNRADDELDDD